MSGLLTDKENRLLELKNDLYFANRDFQDSTGNGSARQIARADYERIADEIEQISGIRPTELKLTPKHKFIVEEIA